MHSNVIKRYRHLWPVAVLAGAATLYGWAVFVSTFNRPGSIGFDYVAPGTDWMVIYGAIRLALTNRFALTIDSDGFTAYINTFFAHFLPHPMFYRPWVYPPAFLIILVPFGLLGFTASYAAFQLAGATLLGGALLARADQPAAAKWVALAALLCPAASINVIDGQCGFLVAGLLVLGFRLLPARPVLAGVVLGLGCVKPQFGLMVPVALIAARQWPAVLGAAVSALGLALASVAAFGWRPWLWWFDRAAFSYGHTGSEWASFERMWGNSVYACAALLHLPPMVCLALQIAAVLLATVFVYRTWRGPGAADRKLAVLLAASLLAAPHFSTYDMLLLAVAGALWFAGLAAPSFAEATLLLLLWLAPLLAPPALVPVGRAEPLLVICFLAVAARTVPGAAFRASAARSARLPG